MAGKTTNRLFRFGAFEVSEATGELRKQGIRIKIHSQPFQMLLMLLERPSELVTRDEMRQQLWDKDTFVDFDHGLNTAVNKLREALGDSVSQPRYIETLPGKGYRFIAAVEAMPSMSAPRAPESTPQPSVSSAAADVPASVPPSSFAMTSATQARDDLRGLRLEGLLAAPHELPRTSHALVRLLLLLTQAMYLAFYLAALANLPEIHTIFAEASFSPTTLTALVAITAVVLIPVRLFLFAAVSFHFPHLPAKFRRLFPFLLPADLLWALSPFLLVHHISIGLALGLTAALVYMPFAQRSLVLMYAREDRC